MLDPDQDSLDAMWKVDLPDYVQPTFNVEGELKKEAPVDLLDWESLLRLCDQGDDEVDEDAPARATGHIRGDAAAIMRDREVDRMRSEPLVDALRDWSEQLYGDLTVDMLRDRIKANGGGGPVQLGRIDGLANGRGYRLADLTE